MNKHLFFAATFAVSLFSGVSRADAGELTHPLECLEQKFVQKKNELEIVPSNGKFVLKARSTALPYAPEDWKQDPKTNPLVYLVRATGAPLDGSVEELQIVFDHCVQDSKNHNLVACNNTDGKYEPSDVTVTTKGGKTFGPISALVTFHLFEIQKHAVLAWETDLGQQRSWMVVTPATSGPGHLILSESDRTVSVGHGYGFCKAKP